MYNRFHRRTVLFTLWLLCTTPAFGQYVPASGTGAAKWAPAAKPTMVGPINVGVVLVVFPDTKLSGGIPEFKARLDNINGLTQEEYFKIYSNGIAWPVAKLYPKEDPSGIYHAPQCYGYYCKFNYWTDPIGWKSTEEGLKRVGILKAEAMRNAHTLAPAATYKTIAVSFITTRAGNPNDRPDIRRYYAAACGGKPENYPDPTLPRRTKPTTPEPPPLMMNEKPFDPWDYYRPSVSWGEPMWPNSSIQFDNASAGTFAHEFGHVLGAPDIYRVGRPNDGIDGTPVLYSYGPTATAFSRFYHHGFVPEKNYPTLTKSGTYTLHPRHIKPAADEALGFVIPSRHPHYYYQVEYIYDENSALGAGGGEDVHSARQFERGEYSLGIEGILISVINLGQSNYLGSPDGFYTYRPGDPYFRGGGNLNESLFGSKFDRQEFNLKSDPPSLLPNLLDGGVTFKNITEHQGTATFDVEIDKTPFPPMVLAASLVPQIKLDPIDQILPTSFHMTAEIKFRGEPLIDQFGMCWNTSRNPDINSDHFVLANCNYDMMQGRALNLRPNTKYYVRAWATNAKGIRYSDEELVVKTLPLTPEVTEVSPLLLDSFSRNGLLHQKFSYDGRDNYGNKTKDYESYSPVAVLSKLAAYYHPDGFLAPHANVAPNPARGDTLGPGHELMTDANPKSGTSKSPVNFGRLHWDPHDNDPPWRTVETFALFQEMRDDARVMKMYDHSLGREFLRGFDHLFRHKLQPQLQPVTAEGLKDAMKLITTELVNARPVVVIESPQSAAGADARIQWGIIDGVREDGSFHVDFPLDTELPGEKGPQSKYTPIDGLIVKNHDLAIVTNISF